MQWAEKLTVTIRTQNTFGDVSDDLLSVTVLFDDAMKFLLFNGHHKYYLFQGAKKREKYLPVTLTGFDTAINAVFPKTEIQNCIIHQLRNSSKYFSYKDLKALMSDLKAVYAAVDEQVALDALETSRRTLTINIPRSQSYGGKLGKPQHLLQIS